MDYIALRMLGDRLDVRGVDGVARVTLATEDINVNCDVMWAPWGQPGLEHLHLASAPDGVLANGLIIGIAEDQPFRARYEIRCDGQWRVREVRVALLDSGPSEIGLFADGNGRWTAHTGAPMPELDGCIDVDISTTPFTNTLPIRRLRLPGGASADLLVVYVDVPTLQLTAERQRYTALETRSGAALYRFEALPSGFTAELWVDPDDLVIDDPQLFRRVWPK